MESIARTGTKKLSYEEALQNVRQKYPNLSLSYNYAKKNKKGTKQVTGVGLEKDDLFSDSLLQQDKSNLSTPAATITKVDLSKSRLSLLDNPGSFEPQPLLGKRKLKAQKRKIRESTKGSKWFNMMAPEVTEERKNDLEALSLRAALDPKRFYKRNVTTAKPKYFQVGKVIANPEEFYTSRLTKKQRKHNVTDEFMTDLK